MILSPERLRKLLDYDPETGIFRWKISAGSVSAGQVAGSGNGKGYLQIVIDYRKYRVHRLAWMHVYGVLPAEHIDHIDGNRANNRIANLREATNAENLHNRGKNANNKSGFKGVSWENRARRWRAVIVARGRQIYLGHYDNPEAAHAAYCEAAKKYHGEFARVE
jgi:hypothetical protein